MTGTARRIIIIVIMSFMLFRPEIYDKFFAADGALNAIGEWSMPSITMVSMVVFLTGIIVFLAGQSKTQAK